MTKNLVIVESPAKAKTIEKFLGKDFTVKSSFGHVRDLSSKNLSIDIEKNFLPKYEISADKKKVVADLKKLSDAAEMVWLATDEDREGEAISWHLLDTLKLPEEKTRRISFNEITKSAITSAIENHRKIDKHLVDAQQARRVLDRLVGYELSPLLWKKVKSNLSAGRVQSVAVRLIVERENEIRNFKSESFFKVTALFIADINGKEHKINAEIPGRFETKNEAAEFLGKCINSSFTVLDVENKPAKKSPAPPFTTSTLQQEASRKLGFSVAKTMMVAQQLYESGKITYMRTDSVNLSVMALGLAKKEIEKLYGSSYVKPRQFTTKSKGAQEAHEAIRPTYFDNITIDGDAAQKRLYDLIWKRTIASQMADAELERTIVSIGISNADEVFQAKGEVILFDGFLKVYLESTDDESDDNTKDVLPPIAAGMLLRPEEIKAGQRFTIPLFRYTEASLVKKMEELGIGRPSTYAPTISTIQKRQYVERGDITGVQKKCVTLSLKSILIQESEKSEKYGFEKAKLIPTDIGILVNDFLINYFNDIIDYNFTAQVEKEFDEIALGNKVWNQVIKEFYFPFHGKVLSTQDDTQKFSGERLLGVDAGSGKNVFAKLGRFGPIVQIGDTESEEKPRFAGLRKNQSINTISLEEALKLFEYPRNLGEYDGGEVSVAIGRFGPYIRYKSKFISLPKEDNPASVELERAIEIIIDKDLAEKSSIIKEFPESGLVIKNGRFGPYIADGKNNYKIPKTTDPSKLSLEDCKLLIEKAGPPAARKKFKAKTKA